jgi:hypothetical protein
VIASPERQQDHAASVNTSVASCLRATAPLDPDAA